MDVKIFPSRLDGIIEAVSYKAMAHRTFIAAALADEPTEIYLNTQSGDVACTLNCLRELGATINSEGANYRVTPLWEKLNNTALLDVGDSGATLRFLLPVACALGGGIYFSGQGKLQKKLLSDYFSCLKGCAATREKLPLTLRGKLSGGTFNLSGKTNSQFISGLLFALPLTGEDCEIVFNEEAECGNYLEMTVKTLSLFGINAEKTERGYLVRGGQKYTSPGKAVVEGDYSTAAYFMGANAFGNRVRVTGLNPESLQEDKKIKEMLLAFNAKGTTLDLKGDFDVAPILAVCACYACSETEIVNACGDTEKEAERLNLLAATLNKLGGEVSIGPGKIKIKGKGALSGGAIVDSFGDAKIALAVAFASTLADNPVTLLDAGAVNKIYPNFFNDFGRLKGKCAVL